MASLFELGDIPTGLVPSNCVLAAPTGTATLTAAQSVNSIIRGVPTGAATYTTASAAAIVAQLGGDCQIGTCFRVIVLNASAGANTITIGNGSGVTISGVATVAQNASKVFIGYVSAIAAGSEAVTYYGLGSTAAAVA